MISTTGGISSPPVRFFTAFAFVDGGYLRAEGRNLGAPYPNPEQVVDYALYRIREMGGKSQMTNTVLRRRTSFYDAYLDDVEVSLKAEIEGYWEYVENQGEPDLRFG